MGFGGGGAGEGGGVLGCESAVGCAGAGEGVEGGVELGSEVGFLGFEALQRRVACLELGFQRAQAGEQGGEDGFGVSVAGWETEGRFAGIEVFEVEAGAQEVGGLGVDVFGQGG